MQTKKSLTLITLVEKDILKNWTESLLVRREASSFNLLKCPN